MNTRIIRLELEFDGHSDLAWRRDAASCWIGQTEFAGVEIRADGEQGHGFGLTEIVPVIVQFSEDVASGVVAAAILSAAGHAVRKVKGRTGSQPATAEGVTAVVETEREQNGDDETTGAS